MAEDTHEKKPSLLKEQVKLIKRKNADRYEIVPIQFHMSFDKGFFTVVRACQLLAEKNAGITVVGIAGPSGAGKTVFTEKILNVMRGVAVISMDNYNDASRVIDDNFDDPRLTDYDTLLKNLQDLKEGNPTDVPIYDFKSSSRTGYRRLEIPRSRIVIIEGIYALSEKLRPMLDLRVSVRGGVHADLAKRVLRDRQRVGQAPQDIMQQITETVYPMYKAYIEPDLHSAHIKVLNKFNPFSGFQNPTYILKSAKDVTVDQVKKVMQEEHTETEEEITCLYLLPPGEDQETCQSYLRMRNKDGRYTLMFEEWVTDNSFIISPRITFEVPVRLLGGLFSLKYTVATILKRKSHVFIDDRVCVKIDWHEQLKRKYVQVQGRDRLAVQYVADQLGLEGSYIPRTYIEQVKLEDLVKEVKVLPEDLRKISPHLDIVSCPTKAHPRPFKDKHATNRKHQRCTPESDTDRSDNDLSNYTDSPLNDRISDSLKNQFCPSLQNEIIAQISKQVSSLSDQMDDFKTCIQEINSKLTPIKGSPLQENTNIQAEACNGCPATSHFTSAAGNGSLTHSLSSSQLTRDPNMIEEMAEFARGQRRIMRQLDCVLKILHQNSREINSERRGNRNGMIFDTENIDIPLIGLTLAAGGVGIFLLKGLLNRK